MHTIEYRILLIEDDQRLARSICDFLSSNGFIVKHFVNGDNLESIVSSGSIDLILCDVMLPGTNGFEIARAIRNKFDGPYIFMSALNDSYHQLKGFKLGADDYITKPVEPELLLARINACLRRGLPYKENQNVIEIENLTIDKPNRVVKVDDQPIALTRCEFDLLWILASQQGKEVSREFLFVNTVGRQYNGSDRTIDGRVSRLRKKLEQYQNLKCEVETLWGQGYLLSVKSQ
ncbi:response regulator transcription factor [Pseudoalteromonas sp. SSDWG2]|uniref:response regulator transcription factor n=1 Tax=Pseudoalteromonas sp. SSDWG2 TaxID=3139391 RepID=UPI003BA87522